MGPVEFDCSNNNNNNKNTVPLRVVKQQGSVLVCGRFPLQISDDTPGILHDIFSLFQSLQVGNCREITYTNYATKFSF
jgi:hypothetical protein